MTAEATINKRRNTRQMILHDYNDHWGIRLLVGESVRARETRGPASRCYSDVDNSHRPRWGRNRHGGARGDHDTTCRIWAKSHGGASDEILPANGHRSAAGGWATHWTNARHRRSGQVGKLVAWRNGRRAPWRSNDHIDIASRRRRTGNTY